VLEDAPLGDEPLVDETEVIGAECREPRTSDTATSKIKRLYASPVQGGPADVAAAAPRDQPGPHSRPGTSTIPAFDERPPSVVILAQPMGLI